MRNMMATMQQQNEAIRERSHLTLVPIERTPEERYDIELVEAIVALDVPAGRRPQRFYKIAKGELHPGRLIARVINDALHAHVDPLALLRALWLPLKRLVERKYRRRLPRKPDDKCFPLL